MINNDFCEVLIYSSLLWLIFQKYFAQQSLSHANANHLQSKYPTNHTPDLTLNFCMHLE
jgi:predicted lipid carrier protein YhbT